MKHWYEVSVYDSLGRLVGRGAADAHDESEAIEKYEKQTGYIPHGGDRIIAEEC